MLISSYRSAIGVVAVATSKVPVGSRQVVVSYVGVLIMTRMDVLSLILAGQIIALVVPLVEVHILEKTARKSQTSFLQVHGAVLGEAVS